MTEPAGPARFEVRYALAAARQLRKLEIKVARRIRAGVDGLEVDPRPEGCRKMVGQTGRWRIRIGDYRVVYEIDDDVLVVLVVALAHRREVYR